jgi:hypothetical protein
MVYYTILALKFYTHAYTKLNLLEDVLRALFWKFVYNLLEN